MGKVEWGREYKREKERDGKRKRGKGKEMKKIKKLGRR